ncbi:RNA polymerase sigma factor [Myxococcota bacterium]|nr:RNA polymerase sigma factor [Myxococcota bacterium]
MSVAVDVRLAAESQAEESQTGVLPSPSASKPPADPPRRSRRKRATGAPAVRVAALTDQELLEGLRSGSEWHFGELYHRYFQRIYNFVHARVRNHVETEEIVQETFIAVFRSFENYRGQSSLLSWIYGIAKNTTNNALRRARTQNERIDLVEEDELLPNAALAVHSPDDLLDLHRFGDELNDRLDQIADWQAEIFAMRHFENLSIPEISRRTNRSSDAVRSSLYRVKRIFFETALPGSSASLPAEDRA